MKKKNILIIFVLLTLPFTVNATLQTTSHLQLRIIAGIDILTPDSLTFPSTFIQEEETYTTAAFIPDVEENTIVVNDYRFNGEFNVTLQVENFKKRDSSIPYSNIAIVTLANASQPDTVDTKGFNIPPGTDSQTVQSPLDCDWDFVSPLKEYCENEPTGFSYFTGINDISDPQLIIDGRNPSNGIGRKGSYATSLGILLKIPPAIEPGSYNSIFTFTLIT